MLGWLKARSRRRHIASDLYERIVAHSRLPAFYEHCGVTDTMNSRLEMILLVMVIVLDRLKREGREGQRLGQLLLERLVGDLDDAFRQIGIGDDGVARRVPRLSGALNERVADYGPWIEDPIANEGGGEGVREAEDRLVAALLEHVYRAGGTDAASPWRPCAIELAAHVRSCGRVLRQHGSEQVLRGVLELPRPVFPRGGTRADVGGRGVA